MSSRYRRSVLAPLVTTCLPSATFGLRRLTAHITNNARRKPSRLWPHLFCSRYVSQINMDDFTAWVGKNKALWTRVYDEVIQPDLEKEWKTSM
jgi:hypothetical protein